MRASRNLSVRARRLFAGTAVAALVVGGLLAVGVAPAQAAAPSNDDIADARPLTGLPTVAGSNADATVESSEPVRAWLGGKSVWYAWTAPSGPDAIDWVRLSIFEADFDTVLTVFSGNPSSFGGLTEVAFNDDFWNEQQRSRVTFQPTPGTTYYVAVDGADWGDGPMTGRFGLRFREAHGSGFMTGKVTDGLGAGVPGICVYVVDENGVTDGPPGYTMANGEYFLNAVPAVPDNRILFRNCGVSDLASEYYDGPGNDGAQTVDDAVGVEVLPGEETEHVDAVLTPGGIVSGSVSGPEGSDVSDVCVRAIPTAGGDLGFVPHTVTGPGGIYELSGLDGGTYTIHVGDTSAKDCATTNAGFVSQSYGYDGTADSSDTIPVVEGAETDGIDVELQGNPGRILGDVRNASTNVALPYICVGASNASYTSPLVDTAADGSFVIPNLPPGTDYVVRFIDCHSTLDPYVTQYYNGKLTAGAANTVFVSPGTDTILAVAQLYRLATIAGTVSDANGNPRPNACVDLHGDGGALVAQTQVAASDGSWSFSVRPGTYTAHFERCSGASGLTFESRWWEDQFLEPDAEPITVAEHQVVDDIDAVLPGTGNGALSGTVTGAGGSPLDDICVDAYRSGPGTLATQTAADGTYSFPDLPTGSYKVSFSECTVGEHNVLPQFYDDQPDLASATTVTVLHGSTSAGVDAQMHPGGSISGRLVDAEGHGIEGVCVDVWEDDGDSYYIDQFYSDANGDYDVRSLPSGTYRVQYVDCSQEFVDQWYADGAEFEDADPLTIVAGSAYLLPPVELTRNGTISGTITDEAGDPVEGFCVFAYEAGDPDNPAGGGDDYYSDAAGHYLIGSLQTGDYKVFFNGCGTPFGDEWHDNKLTFETATEVHVEYGEDTQVSPVVQDTAPANTTLPQVSGSTTLGQTLTATNGTWTHQPSRFDYQWERCDSAGDNCDPVNDGDEPTYDTVPEDVDHRMRVTVTATNSIAGTSAHSAATGLIVMAPVLVTAPSVTGQTATGATLTASNGTWSGHPTSYGFRWLRCTTAGDPCTQIGGATASTYVTTVDDVGHKLRVQVTASNSVGSAVTRSGPTAIIGYPSVVTSPTVSGGTGIGAALTSTPGTWTGDPTYTYQWQRCDTVGGSCSAISGATDPGYTTTEDDLAHRLRLAVTATNGAGSTTARSLATGIIGLPTVVTLPVISGTAAVGEVLSSTTGTWTGDPSYGYTWLSCDTAGGSCTSIPGATDPTYEITEDDAGHRIRVSITASNAAGNTNARSLATATIGIPVVVSAPTVSGATTVGATLTGTTGTWTNDPTSYAYQWTRCTGSGDPCTPIAGANGPTYVTTTDDTGHRIRVSVTAANAAGSGTARSLATGSIGALRNSATPTVSGPVTTGGTLTATNGGWTGAVVSHTYQWVRCAASGDACAPIDSATGSTYVTTVDDMGHRIRVVVTATNAAGSSTARSASTPVIGLPTVVTSPTVSGSTGLGATLSASPGTWSDNPTSYDYQWLRCGASADPCTPIDGATGSTYTTTGDDADHRLRVAVVATNAAGSRTARSLATRSFGAVDIGAYSVTGTCGTLGVTGPGFVMAAGPTTSIPTGTVLTVLASGTANAGTWSTAGGGADIVTLSGTARQITLTAPIPAGTTKAFRTTLSISTAFTLNAATTLPGGFNATGSKPTGSVSSTLILCSGS